MERSEFKAHSSMDTYSSNLRKITWWTQPSSRLCYDHLVSHDFPWFPDFMLWSVWKLVPWRRWRRGRGWGKFLQLKGIPWRLRWFKKKKSVCNVRDLGSIPRWKISWRRKWLSTQVVLPGKSHRQKSLEGYSPVGHKESDTTEWRSTHTFNPSLRFNSNLTIYPSLGLGSTCCSPRYRRPARLWLADSWDLSIRGSQVSRMLSLIYPETGQPSVRMTIHQKQTLSVVTV